MVGQFDGSGVSTDATNKANNALDAALAAFVGAGNVRDHTIISGGKIIAGLIDVDAIKATQGFFDNITVSNSTITSVCNVDKLHFNTSYSPSATNFSNGDIWMVEL